MKLMSRKDYDPFKSSKRESFLDVIIAGGASALVSGGVHSCGLFLFVLCLLWGAYDWVKCSCGLSRVILAQEPLFN